VHESSSAVQGKTLLVSDPKALHYIIVKVCFLSLLHSVDLKGPFFSGSTHLRRDSCVHSVSRCDSFVSNRNSNIFYRNNRCLFGPGLLSSLGEFSISPLAFKLTFFFERKGKNTGDRERCSILFFRSLTCAKWVWQFFLNIVSQILKFSVTVHIFYPIVYKVLCYLAKLCHYSHIKIRSETFSLAKPKTDL